MPSPLLLKLFNVHVDTTGGRIIDAAFTFRRASVLPAAFVMLIVVGFAVVRSYRKIAGQSSPRRGYVMAGLRITLIGLLLAVLLQPTLRLTFDGVARRTLLVMVDATSSMKIADPRTNDDDRKRAAIANGTLDPSGGLAQPIETDRGEPPLSRIDVVRAAFNNPRLNLLANLAKSYDLRPVAFGRGISDLPGDGHHPWVDSIDASSPVTPLGDDLRALLARSRGQPLAGVVIATDGQSNSGSAPLAAAEAARAQGVPLYIWGVGVSNPRDVVVSSVYAQEVAFVGDDVPVLVRVRGTGLNGQSGQVTLSLRPKDAKAADVATQVDTHDIVYDGSDQTVAMHFNPKAAGDFDLLAGIDPRADEAVKDNNSASQRVRVVDGKLKVLLVDDAPRWEFKYLQAMLLRDRRVDLRCVLFQADPSIADAAPAGGAPADANAPHNPYLAQFPAEKAELFKFDLVMLGDVDPHALSAAQLDALGQYVSEFGGGLVHQPGQRAGTEAWRGTIFEKMSPVELPAARSHVPALAEVSAGSTNDNGDVPVHLELTAAGRRSTMLRLSNDDARNGAIWSALPPVFRVAPVAAAKPAAEVLLVDPATTVGRDGAKKPVVAIQQYGRGQVLFVGTDNTWRWRKNTGDRYYAAVWGQIVQRLALPHLLGESRGTQLTAEHAEYAVGARAVVFARIYREGFEPATDPQIPGTISIDNHETGITLKPMDGQPGLYRGEFVVPAAGTYTFRVTRDPKAQLDIPVTEPKLEIGETSMNEPLLRQMALASGGMFFREEDLYKLPEIVTAKTEHAKSTAEVELWASPIVLLLVVIVASLEWLLRKSAMLK